MLWFDENNSTRCNDSIIPNHFWKTVKKNLFHFVSSEKVDILPVVCKLFISPISEHYCMCCWECVQFFSEEVCMFGIVVTGLI